MRISTKQSAPQAPEDQAPGIFDPSVGDYIDPEDPDALVNAYERMDRYYREASRLRKEIALALLALTEGEKKTRRVRGKTRRAKVTLAADSWDQSMLLEAWNAYPRYRDGVLKIGSIRVALREYAKLSNETGPKDFEQFRNMVTQANLGPTGTPRITIEE